MLNEAEGKRLFTWSELTRAVEYTVTFTVASAGAMEFVETTRTNRLYTELPGNGQCTSRVAPGFPGDSVWPVPESARSRQRGIGGPKVLRFHHSVR